VAAEASVANREIPILMCHGREDPIVPLELAEKSADILNDLGYHPRWLDYPMQHQVCAAEMLAISQWLTQVLPPL
jgi:phospholipase/carboxylesterase